MNTREYEELFDLLIDLQNEFLSEESKLKEISKAHEIRIQELELQINETRKVEDIDFRVFSPRNMSLDNSNKVKILEDEKESLSKEKSEADKKMGYYTKKAERLTKALVLLKKINDPNYSVPEELTDINIPSDSDDFDDTDLFSSRKKYNNFAFLEDNDDEEDSMTEALDNVEKLFSEESEPVKIEKYDDNRDSSVTDISSDKSSPVSSGEVIYKEGIPVDELKTVCHKAELSEKIISNDKIRAKYLIKEVVVSLKELIRAYSK